MMNPREEALNKLIKNDNGYSVHSLHPSRLRIDFFPEWFIERMEFGVAYLNKEIRKKYISSDLSNKLDNIQLFISVGTLKTEEFLVDIMGVEDEDYSKYLWFNDGIHRTITVLSTLKREDRYFDETVATPIKELRRTAKEEYKQRPKVEKKKTKWKKKFKWKKSEFEKLILNEEPVKLRPLPEIETEKEKTE